jgi:endonuclease YncB( thermonuclease family)
VRWPWQAKAPTAVYELSDEQVARWRDGDQTVWNEDRKGRQLSSNALAKRQRAEAREEREYGREAGS